MRALIFIVLLAGMAPQAVGAAPLTDTATSVAWQPQWPMFRAEELGLTLGLYASLPVMTFLAPKPPAGWKYSTFFTLDKLVNDHLPRLGEGRDAAILASDILQNSLIAYPFVVDAGIVAWGVHDNPTLAGQLFLMNLEANAIAAVLVATSKRVIGRVRPRVPPCDGDDDYSCRSNSSRRAYVSGHTSAAFTAAGLTCAHHQALPLYGGGWRDGAACLTMLGLATITGALRILTEEHHLSDVTGGATIGALVGYLVPWLFHYGPYLAVDGRYDGELQLSAYGGYVGHLRAPLAALELSVDHGIPVAGRWRMALGADGRLLRASNDFEIRQARTFLEVRREAFGLGFAGELRSQILSATDTQWLFGPTFSAALRDEGSSIGARFYWLPGNGARWGLWSARLFWHPWPFLGFTAEAQSLDPTGATFLVGTTGRLPW